MNILREINVTIAELNSVDDYSGEADEFKLTNMGLKELLNQPWFKEMLKSYGYVHKDSFTDTNQHLNEFVYSLVTPNSPGVTLFSDLNNVERYVCNYGYSLCGVYQKVYGPIENQMVQKIYKVSEEREQKRLKDKEIKLEKQRQRSEERAKKKKEKILEEARKILEENGG